MFNFTSDQTGYIGIHELPEYQRMTAEDVVVSGIVLFAERIDGLVVGAISASPSPTLSLDKSTATIAVGDTVTIKASVNPVGTAITWTSSDTDKATVANGVVTGVASGSATITATAGSVSKTCAVTVSAGA